MRDELGLGHAERAGHPAEEGDVGAEVEVDEAADGGARRVVAVVALAGEVELGEVDAVVDGLDAEDGEEDEEENRGEDSDGESNEDDTIQVGAYGAEEELGTTE